jgi:O-antigen ligase
MRSKLETVRGPSSAWTAYLALAATLAAVLGFGGVYSYVWGPIDIVLFFAVAARLWQWAWDSRRLPWHTILWPMAGFALLVVLQWGLRLSIYPGATLTGLLQLAGGGCVFWLAYGGLSRRSLTRCAWALWLFCGALSVEAIAQALSPYPGYIYGIHRANWASPVGSFVYHNHFAGCMEMLLPIAVVVALRPSRSGEPEWSRWLRRGAAPALGFAAMVLSRSRGGMMALGVETLLAAVIFWRELKPRRWLLLLGAGLFAAFGAATQWLPLLRRFEQLSLHTAGVEERLRVAAACWRIFLHYPWVGTGFNTFAAIYPSFQTFDTGQIWAAAHNDYAQILAETGIAGALCVAAFLAIAGLALRRRWAAPGGYPRTLQMGAFVGMAGLLFHSYGDFQFQNPANEFLFFFRAAMALAAVSEGPPRHHRRHAATTAGSAHPRAPVEIGLARDGTLSRRTSN